MEYDEEWINKSINMMSNETMSTEYETMTEVV